jgi:hypothetical protein
MTKICKSGSVNIGGGHHILCSGSGQLAPVLDGLRGAADAAPTEAVASISGEVADMAALRVDFSQFIRLAQPVGADTHRFVDAPVHNSAAIEPPTVEAQELAHISNL